MKTALIVGAAGQLGRALQACAPTGVALVAHDLDTLDITDAGAIDACLADARPDVLLNAAAYTAVDKAESDEAAAHAVNATAVGLLAQGARKVGHGSSMSPPTSC